MVPRPNQEPPVLEIPAPPDSNSWSKEDTLPYAFWPFTFHSTVWTTAEPPKYLEDVEEKSAWLSRGWGAHTCS